MDELQQFKDTYITECYELLEDMESRLLHLDEDNADLEELNAIFRCAHSIKGGAGAFGFDQITSFTHVLEALLDGMREGKVPPSRDAVDALLKSVDIVKKLVMAAQAGEKLPDDFGQDVVTELQAVAIMGGVNASHQTKTATTTAVASNDLVLYTITFSPHKNLFSSGNEPLFIIRELQTLGKLTTEIDYSKLPDVQHIQHDECHLAWKFDLETTKGMAAIKEVFEFVEDACDLKINMIGGFSVPEKNAEGQSVRQDNQPKPEQVAANQAAKKGPTEEAPTPTANVVSSIRVDVDKVDRLVNMVGELVITQAMLSAQSRHLPIDQYQGLLDGINELSQHTRELQEAVMSVRMQPVKSIFSRMPRIVRDLSKQLGKEIRMETTGENTEVDKTLIEQLSDPLTHMIRNSVDHGIEKPEDRVKNGKPAEGVIRLAADHRGGRIVIEISDDGGGINREKVLSRAKEKGLVAADATLTNEEIDNLVFMPGFSTAEVVTNISGRGVGMDVVKRNIQGLGGTVEIANHPGQGTVLSVSLPLTLAILDGMIIRVGKEHYIIPISSIIETMRPKADEVKKLADGNDVINVRGDFISVLYLHERFNIVGAEHDPSKALVVLVEANRQKFGVVVDELVGQQQVVIKSLTENADPVKGISGATILGDGKVSLILDIGELHHILTKSEANTNKKNVKAVNENKKVKQEENPAVCA